MRNRPLDQFEFGGVRHDQNPVHADPTSANVCHNFRTVPYLRLYGGRKARKYLIDPAVGETPTEAGRWRRLHQYEDPAFSGWSSHLGQWTEGSAASWRWFSIFNFIDTKIESIATTNDGGWVLVNPAPVVNLRDRVVMYNGAGVRSGVDSRPPFSSWYGSELLYFGLDCYSPSGFLPTVSTVAGAIDLVGAVDIYVGIHNTKTQHFSNAKKAGTVAAANDLSIVVAGLNNLSMTVDANHPTESGYLKYVFYATIENGAVPYLLMEANGIDPVTAIAGSTSHTLTTLKRDITKRAPFNNHPPRAMRWIAKVNQRLYGAYISYSGLALGSLPNEDFSYASSGIRQACGIVYSAATQDSSGGSWLGVPEESWPLDNFSPTPNSIIPLWGAPSPSEEELLVFTARRTYLVAEAADRQHDWRPIAPVDGIKNGMTCVETRHGVVWETQRGDIAVFDGQEFRVLSRPYKKLTRGKVSAFGTYTLDEVNMIDRYEIHYTDGTGVAYDFMTGQGFSFSKPTAHTAGTTLVDNLQPPRHYHMLADHSLYSQAGQPENGLELMWDEEYINGNGTIKRRSVEGRWVTQNLDFGEPVTQKELLQVDLVTDGGGAKINPHVEMDLWPDSAWEIDDNRVESRGKLNPQGSGKDIPGHGIYTYRFSGANYFRFRFAIRMIGRVEDRVQYHPLPGDYLNGDPATSMVGGVFSIHYGVTVTGNR